METIEQTEHRSLLAGDTVLVMGLEEFKQELVTRLNAQDTKPKPIVNPNLVFLNTSSEDEALVETIGTQLKKHEIGIALPLRSSDPKQIQEDLELSLSECDGLIIVYGPATHAWARAQILRSRRIIGLRERPLKALAIYKGLPEDKEPLGVELPGMLTLSYDGDLMPFVAALQGG